MITHTDNSTPKHLGISVVTPLFCSEKILLSFYERIRSQLDSLTSEWELILVDDASHDQTWSIACKLHKKDHRVKCIRLARNRGQQHATLCGLSYATMPYVITIDDDLQCYPEDIPFFIEKLETGKHVVIGRIDHLNKQHHWLRNLCSSLNQKLAGHIIGKPKNIKLSSFRAMTIDIARKLTNYKGAHPHIAAMIFKSVPGILIANVNIRHTQRKDGRSSTYSFSKLVKILSYLVINHSYLPLRFMVLWGVFISILSMAYAVWVVFHSLAGNYSLPGWTSLVVLVSFLSGNILLALGILGEYLGRLVEEASNIEQFSIFEERL